MKGRSLNDYVMNSLKVSETMEYSAHPMPPGEAGSIYPGAFKMQVLRIVRLPRPLVIQ